MEGIVTLRKISEKKHDAQQKEGTKSMQPKQMHKPVRSYRHTTGRQAYHVADKQTNMCWYTDRKNQKPTILLTDQHPNTRATIVKVTSKAAALVMQKHHAPEKGLK